MVGTIYSEGVPKPYQMVDLVVDASELTIGDVEELEAMEPTGMGNDGNVLCLRSVRVTDLATVGRGEHLRFKVRSGTGSIGCIWFRMGHLIDMIAEGSTFSVIGNASLHRWNGREEVQMRVIDMGAS